MFNKKNVSFLSVALLFVNVTSAEVAEKTIYQKTCSFLQNNKNAIIASVASAATTAVGFYYWVHYYVKPSYITKIEELQKIKESKSSTPYLTFPVLERNGKGNNTLRVYSEKWMALAKKEQISITEVVHLMSEGFTHPEWLEFWYTLSKKKNYKEIENYIFEFAFLKLEMNAEEIEQAHAFLLVLSLTKPQYKGIYTDITDVIFIPKNDNIDNIILGSVEFL